MNDVKGAAAKLLEATRAIQDLQVAYDAVGWDISDPKFSKLRHVNMHLSVVVGRLAALCEPLDHKFHRGEAVSLTDADQVAAKAIADLIHHTAQIATLFELDIAGCILTRYRKNAERFCPDSDFAKLEIPDTKSA